MAVTGELPDNHSYVRFFQQRIVRMITHWHDHDAVQQLEVTVLDQEREGILKAITLGLEFRPAWPLVRSLITSFTPYMERRGHWETWRRVLLSAIDVAQELADPATETTLTMLLARLSQRMGQTEEVISNYRRTIHLARHSGNRYEEARACSNLGYFYIDRGHWWRSDILSRHALAIFETLENAHGLAHTHNHLAVLHIRRRQWAQAEPHLLNACTIWEEQQDTHSLIYGYLNLGLLQIERGAPAEAIPPLENAVQLVERLGERALLGNILNNLSVAHRLTGNYVDAMQLARQAEAVYRQFGLGLELAQAQHNLGLIHQALGEMKTAKALLQTAKAGYQRFNYIAGLATLAVDWEQLESAIVTTVDS